MIQREFHFVNEVIKNVLIITLFIISNILYIHIISYIHILVQSTQELTDESIDSKAWDG